MVTGVNSTRKTNISCGLGAQFSPLKDPSRTFSWVVSPSLWFLKDGWENQLVLTVFKVLCFMVFHHCSHYMTRNRKDRLYPATFFPAPKPQVRDEVHKRIAELTAWSMDFAGQGKWPHNGFQGEAFSAGTTRFKQKGKELAKGWRIPSPYLLQNLSVLLSSKCNGSFDVGIHGEPS